MKVQAVNGSLGQQKAQLQELQQQNEQLQQHNQQLQQQLKQAAELPDTIMARLVPASAHNNRQVPGHESAAGLSPPAFHVPMLLLVCTKEVLLHWLSLMPILWTAQEVQDTDA